MSGKQLHSTPLCPRTFLFVLPALVLRILYALGFCAFMGLMSLSWIHWLHLGQQQGQQQELKAGWIFYFSVSVGNTLLRAILLLGGTFLAVICPAPCTVCGGNDNASVG